MSAPLKTGVGLAVSILFVGVAASLLLRAFRLQRAHSPEVVASAVVSAPNPSALVVADSGIDTATLKAQLTDRQMALQVRVTAARPLKKLAGQGQADLAGAQLDGAPLEDAYFYSANLTGASFRRARAAASPSRRYL